jgi:hypothetical protein
MTSLSFLLSVEANFNFCKSLSEFKTQAEISVFICLLILPLLLTDELFKENCH